ncbi:protein of unknown function [Sterolibacterium denitrificans]|uniref:PAS domain-containing protein n=2 Tax=Sterolibacterium denitrificans TaxID=157592 RepID=A0A7Z7MVX5_9PROT|nr:protein of unknown function [Sterolibacterium denitrificans]
MGSHRRAVPRLLRLLRAENGEGRVMPLPGGGATPADFSALKSLVRHLQRQRRLDADELHRSKERFQALVESLPLKVFVKDATARYVACNSLFASDLGLTPEQVAGRNDFDFYPAHDAERFLREDGRIIGSGNGIAVHENVLQDGLEKIVYIVKAPFHDARGEVAGVIGAILDVTGNKQNERRLRQFAYEIEDLYQCAPCAYQSIDADGVLRRINNTALAWLGYRRDEVIGRLRLEDLLSETSRLCFAGVFPDLMQSGALRELALDLVRKDGCLLPVSLNAIAVYDDDGNFVASNLAFSDVAVRCELAREQRMQQRRLNDLGQRLAAVRAEERQRLAAELQARAVSKLADMACALTNLARCLPEDFCNEHREQLDGVQALLDGATADILDICAGQQPAIADFTVQPQPDSTLGTQVVPPWLERRRSRCRRQAASAAACRSTGMGTDFVDFDFVERRSGISRRSQDRQQSGVDLAAQFRCS